ncbi:hypothetical protein LTR70_009069 [Exophiala xenobiotica]|uniref:Clr5 domain-containing protein n=1 Tax=Lithohypha guttulata TaxID=1690604 RepID=A0ABR0K8R9_9EURO|nr:hypothetical protein LTR24_005605 [Lithohypha guttulata]KAK5311021.1 hypothetical protein LTR70_009069 [Exophiala xenobiotica]
MHAHAAAFQEATCLSPARYHDEVHQLYIIGHKTQKQVREILAARWGFTPTKRQLVSQLRRWGMRRNESRRSTVRSTDGHRNLSGSSEQTPIILDSSCEVGWPNGNNNSVEPGQQYARMTPDDSRINLQATSDFPEHKHSDFEYVPGASSEAVHRSSLETAHEDVDSAPNAMLLSDFDWPYFNLGDSKYDFGLPDWPLTGDDDLDEFY